MHLPASLGAAILLSALTVLISACGPADPSDSGPAAPVAGTAPLIEATPDVSDVRTALTSQNSGMRIAAARAASRVRPLSLVEADLLDALRDPDAALRLAAVESLSQPGFSNAATAPLLRAFEDPDPRVRIAAALAVRDFRPQALELVPQVIGRIGGSDTADARLAAEQLQFLWPAIDDEYFLAVTDLLAHPDTRIRQVGALTLNKALVVRRNLGLNPTTGRLVERLTTALWDIDADIRRDAARSLEALGTIASSSWTVLESRLQSEPDLEAGQAMMMAARSVDAAGRSSFPQARSGIWNNGPSCVPGEQVRLAGLSPHDPVSALTVLDDAPAALTAREGWSLAGPYVVFSHHYPDFAVDTAGGTIERLSSRSTGTVLPNGLRAGLTRNAVLDRLGAQPSRRAQTAGIFRQRICDRRHDDLVLEIEFDATGTVSEINVVRSTL